MPKKNKQSTPKLALTLYKRIQHMELNKRDFKIEKIPLVKKQIYGKEYFTLFIEMSKNYNSFYEKDEYMYTYKLKPNDNPSKCLYFGYSYQFEQPSVESIKAMHDEINKIINTLKQYRNEDKVLEWKKQCETKENIER